MYSCKGNSSNPLVPSGIALAAAANQRYSYESTITKPALVGLLSVAITESCRRWVC